MDVLRWRDGEREGPTELSPFFELEGLSTDVGEKETTCHGKRYVNIDYSHSVTRIERLTDRVSVSISSVRVEFSCGRGRGGLDQRENTMRIGTRRSLPPSSPLSRRKRAGQSELEIGVYFRKKRYHSRRDVHLSELSSTSDLNVFLSPSEVDTGEGTRRNETSSVTSFRAPSYLVTFGISDSSLRGRGPETPIVDVIDPRSLAL